MRLMPRGRTEWRRVLFIARSKVKVEKLSMAQHALPTALKLRATPWPAQGRPVFRYRLREQSHAGQPLSNTTRQWPSGSRRQIELKVPIWRPVGSRTGPLLRARDPDSRTSTISGLQENGAARPSKKGRQPATTAALPCSVPRRPKKTASTATYIANAWEWRSASVCAKALSASKTCRASAWRFCAWAGTTVGQKRSVRGTKIWRRMKLSSSGGGGGESPQGQGAPRAQLGLVTAERWVREPPSDHGPAPLGAC